MTEEDLRLDFRDEAAELESVLPENEKEKIEIDITSFRHIRY